MNKLARFILISLLGMAMMACGRRSATEGNGQFRCSLDTINDSLLQVGKPAILTKKKYWITSGWVDLTKGSDDSFRLLLKNNEKEQPIGGGKPTDYRVDVARAVHGDENMKYGFSENLELKDVPVGSYYLIIRTTVGSCDTGIKIEVIDKAGARHE